MTALVRWDPFAELGLLDPMRGIGLPLMRLPTMPATDIYETDDEYVVELEAPGYEEKELTIEVLDHVLTVKGAHEAEAEKNGKTYRLQERLAQQFERRFMLPSTADTGKVNASFSSGILEVHARKAKVATPKKIHVET